MRSYRASATTILSHQVGRRCLESEARLRQACSCHLRLTAEATAHFHGAQSIPGSGATAMKLWLPERAR